jgi:hypothetical protein
VSKSELTTSGVGGGGVGWGGRGVGELQLNTTDHTMEMPVEV